MTRRRWIPLTLIAAALTLLAAATVWARTWAQEPAPAAPRVEVGTAFTYQGQLKSDGEPVTGTCDMEFRLYADAGGSTQVGPLVSSPISVAGGYFTTELDFGSGAFDGEARWLGIQVQCAGDPSMVDLGLQALTPAPYALSAPWSGLSGVPAGFADGIDNDTTYQAGTGLDLDLGAFSIEVPFQLPQGCSQGAPAEFDLKTQLWECGTDASGWQPARVILVAKGGGDYTSIQAAIDSIKSATADNPYLVWVAPGVYQEQVIMAPYVHLQGAGQEATIIRSDADVTLYLAEYTSLRDLTVLNVGTESEIYAIRARSSQHVTGTLVADVTARGQGTADSSSGIRLDGASTRVRMLDVTAHAENASDRNYGLQIWGDSTAILEGGSFTASGGIDAQGISTYEGTLDATGVFALAENTTGNSIGLYISQGTATLRGGSFAAHGSDNVYGIANSGSMAVLAAESVTAEGLDAITHSYGLHNTFGASATLHGGSFTARGGSSAAHGIYSDSSGTVLRANGISALAEDADLNYGLICNGSASTYVTLSILEGSYFSVYGSPYDDTETEITHSRLVDGPAGGSTDCVAVSHGTVFGPDYCP